MFKITKILGQLWKLPVLFPRCPHFPNEITPSVHSHILHPYHIHTRMENRAIDTEEVITSAKVVVEKESDTKKEDKTAEGGQKCGHFM